VLRGESAGGSGSGNPETESSETECVGRAGLGRCGALKAEDRREMYVRARSLDWGAPRGGLAQRGAGRIADQWPGNVRPGE